MITARCSLGAAESVDGPPLVAKPPHPLLAVSVIIPARNEEAAILRTLTGLSHQTDQSGEVLDPRRYEIIVLANNCVDRTAALVRSFAAASQGPVVHLVERELPPDTTPIGQARRLLMDEADRRLQRTAGETGLIASTDADTVVATDWISAMLAEVHAGAAAIGGRILLDRQERAQLPPRVVERYLRDLGYRRLVNEYESRIDPLAWDPWPRHHQYFGASMAVTVEAYERVGGLPPLAVSEDEALHAALVRADVRVRHSPAVRVTTSARRAGRTAGGLAGQLCTWATAALERQPHLVEPAATVVALARARANVRQAWHAARARRSPRTAEVCETARLLGLDCDWLAAALLAPRPFGALWDSVRDRSLACDPPDRKSRVEIIQATADLRALVSALR